ncbi:MAG: hypothetical protein V1839_00445, partial [archaeon]
IVPIVAYVMFYFLLSDMKNKAPKNTDIPEPWMAFLMFIPIAGTFIMLYLAYKIQTVLNALDVETF